jgi:Ni,Fe-hydrogenase III large subunit
MNTLKIHNGEAIPFGSIPITEYTDFIVSIEERLSGSHPEKHCVNYFGYAQEEAIQLIICIADDEQHDIELLSYKVKKNDTLPSAAIKVIALERFEREIAENHGIHFEGHPWLKPVRTASDNYPFFSMEGDEYHEVGVGPIHAGVIEPGHFRFICNGEEVMHLEIMLGYQHRGVEQLFLKKKRLIERSILAESIAGDTAVSHSIAFASVWESLCGMKATSDTIWARTLASEIERMAIHTGDLSAICGDVAYQLGSAVFGRLRTPIINFMQQWCGNRLGKGCVRPFETPYPFTEDLSEKFQNILSAFERDFNEMSYKISRYPSVLSRLERTGTVTFEQVSEIGAVGMAARASGLNRDIRKSHPNLLYKNITHTPIVKHHGDVYSRTQIREEEVRQSMQYIRTLLSMVPKFNNDKSKKESKPLPSTFTISLTEGWRGEICHCAITDENGEIALYKIKDPSFHNWMALALAVRNNEISDFPICNKSFNLSYCGHDL